MNAILLALTSHDDLGGTRPTGFYVSEAAHPWRVFRNAGIAVDLVSMRGGRPPMDGFDTDDPTQREFVQLPDLAATRPAAEVDAVGYDAIFYVGGHGTMWDFRTTPTSRAWVATSMREAAWSPPSATAHPHW